MTVICVCDGKQPQIDGFLYVSGEGSFPKVPMLVLHMHNHWASLMYVSSMMMLKLQKNKSDLFVYVDKKTFGLSIYHRKR